MNNGGSAFPVFDSTRIDELYGCREFGMTLRDYFAGQALASVIIRLPTGDKETGTFIKTIAELSYSLADAMLTEKEKQNDGGNGL